MRGMRPSLPATQAASMLAACAMGPIFCGPRGERGGARVLPGGASLPYRTIGLLKKKFAEILEIFGIWLRPMAHWEAPSVCDKPRYRPDTSIDCK